MQSRYLLSILLAGAVAVPAGAQERPEREPEVRIRRLPGAFEAMRGPRAVLGIATSAGNGLADTAGVLVADVIEGGPAARAGIQEGARLTEIDGISLRISAADAEDPMLGGIGSRRLTRELGKKNPGDEVALRVVSGGQSRDVRVRLADADSLRPRRVEAPRAGTRAMVREAMANRASIGIQVGSTGSRRDTLGVFVMGVDDEGPAARAGIIEGHRIATVNGVDLRVGRADAEDPMVSSARVQQLRRALRDVKPGDDVELRVWQNGQYRNVRVRAVPADSLRGNRRTIIVGDAFGGPEGMSFGPGFGFPGDDGAPFRLRVAPGFDEDIEMMLEGVLGRARRAMDGARTEARVRERLH